jgi:PAS domain S-box-containing protein
MSLLRARNTFAPFGATGRQAIAGIMLAFVLYTGLSLFLSARLAGHSEHRAEIVQVAARQRTLVERYAKEVQLSRTTGKDSAAPIAQALVSSVNALLHGGTAPGIPGDDDAATVPAAPNAVVRNQLLEERRLIRDLVATGSAIVAKRPVPVRVAGHEHFASGLAPIERLRILTGVGSNVSLNATRSLGEVADHNVVALVSLQRILAATGLAIFGVLSWALVATTRRRSAHFRSLVTSTTDLVLVYSGDRCRYASNSVLRMLDCDESTILRDGVVPFVHPDDLQRIREVVAAGGNARVEFRLATPDGWRHVEGSITDLRHDRDVRGLVLNARDVTERHNADVERERLLEQEKLTNERLRELDRLKDEFVALVSHELRTPLTSIRGFLELLTDAELSDEQRAYTDVIGRNSDRLLRLINDLLFIAQIESGQLTVEHDRVDLAAIVAQAVASAAPAAKAGSVTLTSETPDTLAFTGDAGRLAQLLDNLISNGIKFTPAGGTVAVSSGIEDGLLWIEVQDTGIGLSAADHERLFERFFRTRAATTASIQGTGLGLAISKAIAQAHGGAISVTSAEGDGSTFRVDLPTTHRARTAEASLQTA